MSAIIPFPKQPRSTPKCGKDRPRKGKVVQLAARAKFSFRRPFDAGMQDEFQPIRIAASIARTTEEMLSDVGIIPGDMLAGLITDEIRAGDLVFLYDPEIKGAHLGIIGADEITLVCGCYEADALYDGQEPDGRIVGQMRRGEYITPAVKGIRPILEWPELIDV